MARLISFILIISFATSCKKKTQKPDTISTTPKVNLKFAWFDFGGGDASQMSTDLASEEFKKRWVKSTSFTDSEYIIEKGVFKRNSIKGNKQHERILSRMPQFQNQDFEVSFDYSWEGSHTNDALELGCTINGKAFSITFYWNYYLSLMIEKELKPRQKYIPSYNSGTLKLRRVTVNDLTTVSILHNSTVLHSAMIENGRTDLGSPFLGGRNWHGNFNYEISNFNIKVLDSNGEFIDYRK